jgi:hypothetical protein
MVLMSVVSLIRMRFAWPRRARVWLLVGLLLPLAAPRALPLAELCQVTVPVAGADAEQRNQAIEQALEKVLVKLTGSRSIAMRPEVADLLKSAAPLVQQYRYGAAPAADTAQPQQRWLQVSFDAAALQQALRAKGLPVWQAGRPNVLLWLGLEQGGARNFLQPESDVELAATIAAVAAERGLSLLFPLLDVEDLSQLRASDLWGGFEDRLRAASQRYAADLVLVGRLGATSPGSWSSSWVLLHSAQAERWQSRGASAPAALAAGLQEAVDRLARRYAPLESRGTSNRLLVRVSDVRDARGFAGVDRLLRALDVVEEVALVSVEPDRVLFSVKARGGADALQRATALSRWLLAEPDAAGVDADRPDLRFRLVP